MTLTYKDNNEQPVKINISSTLTEAEELSIKSLVNSHEQLSRERKDNHYNLIDIAKTLGIDRKKFERLKWQNRELTSLCVGTIHVMIAKGKQLRKQKDSLQKVVDTINQFNLL